MCPIEKLPVWSLTTSVWTHFLRTAALQMVVRALKEEHTAVKMLYLASYGTVISVVAMVADNHQWTVPDLKQAALLLLCGVA